MAVAYFVEFPGGSHESAQQLGERLEQQGALPPAGGVSHTEGPMEGGWWAFDTWDSDERAREFYDQQFAPVLQELGLSGVNFRKLDVHMNWHSNDTPME